MATNEVIRFFRKRNNIGFDPITYLGAEQRFITPLRNSNLNNLEEQLILGVDSYSEEYKDEDENLIINKSFFIDDSEGYYKVETIVYKEAKDDNIYYDNEHLKIIKSDKENLPENPEDYKIIQIDKLFFIKDNGNTKIPVLTKITSRKYLDEGKKEILQERIVNHLKGE